ncbi:MAG: DUF421 domain-containing protein [Defluviitaleaceae bacterium]|nr:DUF421 domain-containing protein [Defluviitaleaceae bacterium]
MHVIYSVLLAIFFYLAIVISYKLMGKREISELSIFDFVMNLIIADVVATGIVEEEFWLDSFTGLIALVLLQIVMAKLQLKKPKLRKYINGESSMIIKNGKIDFDELTKLRIQLDELMMMLRQSNVIEIEGIQYAIIESNGKLSIYEKRLPTKTFPLPFVISGMIKPYALENAGLQEDWLHRQLAKHQITLDQEVKYLFYDEKHLILHTKTDFKKYKIN